MNNLVVYSPPKSAVEVYIEARKKLGYKDIPESTDVCEFRSTIWEYRLRTILENRVKVISQPWQLYTVLSLPFLVGLSYLFFMAVFGIFVSAGVITVIPIGPISLFASVLLVLLGIFLFRVTIDDPSGTELEEGLFFSILDRAATALWELRMSFKKKLCKKVIISS